MAYVDWRIKGPQLSTCNCQVGCPCQFNALPTHGDCRAADPLALDWTSGHAHLCTMHMTPHGPVE
jgi:hypothetical protein